MRNCIGAVTIVFILLTMLINAQTQDFIEQQTYLYDANYLNLNSDIGLGIQAVWALPGGQGQGVQIVDIERNWNLSHEDLPPGIPLVFGSPGGDNDHGTAVVGILAGVDNGFGITGISPAATVLVSSRYLEGNDSDCGHDQIIANAIAAASNAVQPGDILLVEVQAGLNNGKIYPAEYCPLTLQAIKAAVNSGRIVVEAAGNAGLGIDGALNYPADSSGAIIVAAGLANQLIGIAATNHGDRVDVHAWGENVVTTGYGTLAGSGTPTKNDDYANNFNGTSSAAALVAGAAACLQGIYYAYTGSKLAPAQLRNILRYSGIPHQDPYDNIGRRLYLPWAINYMKDHYNTNNQLDDLPYFIPIQTDQFNAGGARFGDIQHHKLSRYFEHPAPYTFDFAEGSQQVLKTLQTLIPGTYQKFNEWLDISTENHLRFLVDSAQTVYYTNFDEVFSATFNLNLLHGGSGGKLQLKDPWYINDNNPQYNDPPYGYRSLGDNAIFEDIPDEFQITPQTDHVGVFLNQGLPNWQPPYYSVQAPTQPITVNGKAITWDWESWSYNPAEIALQYPNSNPTAVVFKTPNATLTANLKGRRTSDIPEATAGNNGRKITYHWADVSTRKPYLVYEDRGNIYSASQNALGQWQKDGRIAAAAANLLNQTPAVAYLHEISGSREDKRVIAWAEYDLSEDNYLVQSSLAGFPEPDWQMPDPPHPTASGYRLHQPAASTAVAAFHGSGALPLEGLDNGIWLWFTRDGTLYQVSGEASADYPALDNRQYQPSLSWKEPWYFVAWQEAAGIQYRRFYRRNDAGSEVTVDQNILLNQGYFGLSSHERPSLAAVTHGANDNVDVFVAWQALVSNDTEENVPFPRGIETDPCTFPALEKRVVCFRENRAGWQPLNIFTIDNTCNRNPVVTAWDAGNPRDCVIIYEKGGGEVDYLYRESGEWHPAEALTTDGNHPSLSSLRFGDSDVPHAVWSEHAAAPYRVQHGEISLTPTESLASQGQAGLPHSRRIYFRLKEALAGGNQLPIDGEVTLEIADPQWLTTNGAQPVKPLYRDSLITPENAFRFNAINVSQAGERLIVPVKIVGRNLKRVSPIGNNPFPLPLLRLRLKDGNSGQVLNTVHTFQSSILGNDSTHYIAITDTFEIELSGLVNRRIQLEGATFFNLYEPGKGRPQIAEVYDLREESSQARLAGKVPAATNAGVPGQFALSQNYPNPFNPATNIEFQLPQNSHVSLKIYDLQGRLVKTLANGEFPAGTHRVEWDGRDERGNAAASGIYLYHFVAGTYQQTRKMALLR